MKKLMPDSKVTIREGLPAAKWRSLNKQLLQNVEHHKVKSSKFWDGVLLGLILGYIPYLWHMHL